MKKVFYGLMVVVAMVMVLNQGGLFAMEEKTKFY